MNGARGNPRRGVVGSPRRLLLAFCGTLVCMVLGACGSDLGSSGGDTAEATVADTQPVSGKPVTIATAVLYIDKSQGAVDGPGSTIDNFTQQTGIDVDYLEEINSNESE